MTRLASLLLALSLLAPAMPVHAQASGVSDLLKENRPQDGVRKLVDALTEDIPMTIAPAAFVLGVAGEQVPRYTTFREFAVGLGRGIDKDGKFTNNVSAEIAPALALRVLRLEDQTSAVKRALARTTFSLVTIAGSNSEAAKTAYGVQSVLYSRELDQAITLAGIGVCRATTKRFIEEEEAKRPVKGGIPETPTFSPEDDRDIAECQKTIDAVLNRWNQTMVAAGFGQAFRSPDNSVSGLSRANKVGWVTGSWGFGYAPRTNESMGGLLVLHARFERDGIAPTPGAAQPQSTEDADLYGVSLRIGKARFNGLAEYSERSSEIAGLADETRKRTLLGAEYRLREDLYLSFAVGSETGRRDGKNNNLSLANLKWGFGGKPVFAP